MTRLLSYISLLFVCVFISCSSLKHATNFTGKKDLSDTTLNRLTGKYKPYSIVPNTQNKADLSWNIFDVGYNPKTEQDFVEIKMISKNELSISYWDSTTLIKSKVFKGRIKDGYFVFKRKYLIIPALIVNLFRNRIFRIGVLSNGNLITDYNQISFGSFYFIIPDWKFTKQFGVEFQRLN